MANNYPIIFGIGNPLIDVVIKASEKDLTSLGLTKGTMQLVDEKRQEQIINYFKGTKNNYFPGGSAPNTILACSGLGIHSHIAGKIGKDELGNTYIERVNEYGADSGIVFGDGRTGSSIILVTPDGERTMNTHLGMCQEYGSNDIDEEKLSKAKFFYFTGYMWDTDSQKSAIKKAIQIAQDNKVKIVFDVADPFAVDRNRDSFLRMIEKDVDIVFANQSELKILLDSEDIDFCIDNLMEIVNSGGIKLGKEGSLIFDNNKKYVIKPSPILAKDSTGAGDMYAAGFLTSIAKGEEYGSAGEIAVHLAEEIIQVQGAQFEKDVIVHLAKKIL
ncbi:MAG: adenosine kinase [Candidatus Marinimicrobia bacterium]|nr:adenosine kinase [Candidatus Neomarinimicrobiota bacterium]